VKKEFDDMQKKMEKIFGDSGNLQAFVQDYENDKKNNEKIISEVAKKHSNLKQTCKDDYEQIINLMQGFDKKLIKIDLEKNAVR
jgi:F0F1-type ATP synthase delta subunit